jgi:hypothetical protein
LIREDVGVRLEQADHLVGGGDRLAGENAALGLGDDLFDHRAIAGDLGPPQGSRPGRGGGERLAGLPQIGEAVAGDLEEIAIGGDALLPAAAIFDGAQALPGGAAMVTPGAVAAGAQPIGRLQQAHHHTHRIAQKAAVARRVDRRGGDGRIEPHHAAVLELVVAGARQQRPIDRLPGLAPDRADGLVQHRLLRAEAERQPREGAKRGGVFQMEGQFLVAQLAVLLEQRAAQSRLGWQALPSGLFDGTLAEVARHQADQVAVLVEPRGHRLELAPDLVFCETIE